MIDASSSRPISIDAGRGSAVDEDEYELVEGFFARWHGRSGDVECLRSTCNGEFWSSACCRTDGLELNSDIGRLRAAALSAAEKIMPASCTETLTRPRVGTELLRSLLKMGRMIESGGESRDDGSKRWVIFTADAVLVQPRRSGGLRDACIALPYRPDRSSVHLGRQCCQVRRVTKALTERKRKY